MNWEIIASLATAFGVGIAAWQLWASRKIAQTTFEDSLDQQYRKIVMQIPVDALLGRAIPDEEKRKVREKIYNYLDLCNEQAYLRKKARITKARWKEWNEGIAINIKKPAFKEVWDEVKGEAPATFSSLKELEDHNFSGDPAKEYK
jgi:hypothetical protein